MPFVNPRNVLIELNLENGSNYKTKILSDYEENELVKKVFKYTLDPLKPFFMKKIPSYSKNKNKLPINDQYNLIFKTLDKLASREITGYTARDEVIEVLSTVDDKQAQMMEMILSKDLKCGVNTSTANKVWGKKFIEKKEVMLCTSYSEKAISKIEFPAYSQLKMDGARMTATVDSKGNVLLMTRNGKVYHGLERLEKELEALCAINNIADIEFDGELLFLDSLGNIEERKISNGLANKSVKDTIEEDEANAVHYCIWDMYRKGNRTPYNTRLGAMTIAFANWKQQTKVGSLINLVETKEVNSIEEARDMYKKAIADKMEGIVLKNKEAIWEGKRSKHSVKFKEEIEADMLIVGREEGTGKNKGRLGALYLESGDGKVKCKVGTGFSDAQREKYTKKYVVGKIAEIKYNQVISSKDKRKKHSLFLPVFLELRFDKTEADIIEVK